MLMPGEKLGPTGSITYNRINVLPPEEARPSACGRICSALSEPSRGTKIRLYIDPPLAGANARQCRPLCSRLILAAPALFLVDRHPGYHLSDLKFILCQSGPPPHAGRPQI